MAAVGRLAVCNRPCKAQPIRGTYQVQYLTIVTCIKFSKTKCRSMCLKISAHYFISYLEFMSFLLSALINQMVQNAIKIYTSWNKPWPSLPQNQLFC